MLDFCLLHYLLSSDSKVNDNSYVSSLHKLFFKTLNTKTKLVLYLIILKVIPLGLALVYRCYPLAMETIWAQFLMLFLWLSLFLFLFCNWNFFFNIVNSFVRKKVYLLTYLPFDILYILKFIQHLYLYFFHTKQWNFDVVFREGLQPQNVIVFLFSMKH